jgi:murein DD-endopeptidase MepM/ murein hydrolase activator NlpD
MRTPATADQAARELEATLVRQLLSASGAFHAGDTPGAKIHADMFIEVLADAVAARDGLGLAKTLTRSLPGGAEASRAPGAPPPPGPTTGPLLAPRPAPTFAMPAGVRQTGGFGPRIDPIDGTRKVHTGVDLAAPEGTPVVAVEGGVVKSAGPRGGYGNAVEIDHGGGVSTVYAHASSLAVHAGERVEEGQTIAAVGQTGRATGPHLHFELRVGGRPCDPARALNAYGKRVESPLGKTAGASKP